MKYTCLRRNQSNIVKDNVADYRFSILLLTYFAEFSFDVIVNSTF